MSDKTAAARERRPDLPALSAEQFKKLRPKLVVMILNRSAHAKAVNFFSEHRMRFNYLFLGQGTASSEIMDILGLGNIDKVLSATLVPAAYTEHLIQTAQTALKLDKPGGGIAFSMPIAGVSKTVLQTVAGDLAEIALSADDENEVKIMSEAENFLVVAAVNPGYGEELMTEATKAGARGGTIIHARRAGTEESAKFFGISIQAEKEVILILTNKDNKKNLMEKLGEQFGFASEAHGVILALPVESTAGMQNGA